MIHHLISQKNFDGASLLRDKNGESALGYWTQSYIRDLLCQAEWNLTIVVALHYTSGT